MLNSNARTGRTFELQFLLFFFGHLLKFVLAVELELDKFNQRLGADCLGSGF